MISDTCTTINWERIQPAFTVTPTRVQPESTVTCERVQESMTVTCSRITEEFSVNSTRELDYFVTLWERFCTTEPTFDVEQFNASDGYFLTREGYVLLVTI